MNIIEFSKDNFLCIGKLSTIQSTNLSSSLKANDNSITIFKGFFWLPCNLWYLHTHTKNRKKWLWFSFYEHKFLKSTQVKTWKKFFFCFRQWNLNHRKLIIFFGLAWGSKLLYSRVSAHFQRRKLIPRKAEKSDFYGYLLSPRWKRLNVSKNSMSMTSYRHVQNVNFCLK